MVRTGVYPMTFQNDAINGLPREEVCYSVALRDIKLFIRDRALHLTHRTAILDRTLHLTHRTW